MPNVSSSDAVRALDTGQNYRPVGCLQVKLGSQVGLGSVLPGDPGGPGGPPGPDPGSVSYPAPAVGTGWEVRVLAAPAYNILLAIMPSQVVTTVAFVKQLKDTGSGTVTVNLDDPFWDEVTLPNAEPAHYLLDYEHLWQVIQDGVIRFEFLGETVTEQLADNSEQRIATVTGPGSGAALKWAMAAPPGFPDNVRYKLDAITESFNAVDVNGNFVIDYDLWNASAQTADISVNPSGSARLMGHPSSGGGATILGTTAYDATNTLVSAQVAPIVSPDASGASLDGSQVTQMYIQSLANPNYYALFGLSATEFYCQFGGPSGTYTKTICSAAAFNTAMQGTNAYQYWQISEKLGDAGPTGWGTFYFWTSSDAQNWKQEYSIRHNWDATNVGLYFLAQYSVDNKQPATITGLNSNISTSSLAGPLYYNQPIMGVWTDLLTKAKQRGTIPFITTGPLGAATDSFGNVWSDTQSVQIQNGTDLLALLQAHTSMINADWVVQPGFRVQVGLPVTGKISLGFDRSNQVVFRDGADCAARVRSRVRNQVQNLLGVINQDGRTLVAENTSSEAIYGQREAWLQAAMQVSLADLAVVATAADLEKANEVLSYTLTVSPYMPGRTIFTGFDVGDWVGLERPDFSAIDKVRVVAIAVQVANDGAETHEVTLSTYIQWLAEQLDYIQTKMGGGFLSATGTSPIPDNAQLTNRNTPTIAKPTLPGLAGVMAGGPNAGAPLVYDPNTGSWVPAGTIFTDTGGAANVIVQGTGSQVVLAGQGLTVQNTPQAPADGPGSSAPPAQGQVIGVGSTAITDANGTTRVVVGVQSDGTYGATAAGAPAPNAPDAPTITGTLNGILVTWDGLLNGTNPLADFLWCEVHVSTSNGFTPGTDTLKGTLVSAAVFPVTGLTVGTTYYVKLLARNTSGTTSAASTQQSGVPTGLSASTVGQLGVLNANPYFAGGDGATWAGYNGTFSVSASPPAGTPYPYAGFFTVSSSGGAMEENGQPFKAAPAQAYYVTAWIYSSDTTCVIGFDWQNSSHSYLSTSTETITVTANTWTLVTTVQTSPASTGYAYPRIAPANTVGHTIYATGILCLQQVPGALIQAGTITAAQIAAHTITAAVIASHTITAAEIAADTVTAAEIAAGTITASEIASGTITAGLLAAGIVKAGIVDGTSISAATFIAYGTNGNLLIYTGTPASGNLLCVISPAAGSDSYSNAWDQGITLNALSGLTNMFSVKDPTTGDALASIDASGNISGATLSATNDLQVGGNSVGSLITSAPLGLVNYGWKAIGGTAWPSTAITSEKALFELDQQCTAGRVYQFEMAQTMINANTGGGAMHIHLRYTTDGSTPSTSSSEAVAVSSRVETAGTDAHIGPLTCIFGPYASDTTLRCLVTGHAGANSWQFKNDDYVRCAFYDLGTSMPDDNNLYVLGSGTSGGSSGQIWTKTYYATETHSYYGSGASDSNGKRSDNSTCYQGMPAGGSSSYGDQHSYARFNYSQIADDLGSGTVNWVKVRLTSVASRWASGCRAIVGWTEYTGTFGDPFIPGAGTHFNTDNYWIGLGATVTHQCGSSMVSAITSGFAGLAFGRSADYSTASDGDNYGGWFGYSASNHSACPALIINYTK